MGAGKSTAAAEVGRRLGRPVAETDELVGAETGDIARFFADHGESAFRQVEEREALLALRQAGRYVVSLGGGAVCSEGVRRELAERAFTIWLDVDVDTCWERARDSGRPLARDHDRFRRLYEERRGLYSEVADAVAHDADGIVLAAGGVHVAAGSLERLGDLVPGQTRVALVSDANVAGIHGPAAQVALGSRLTSTHELPPGEQAKTLGMVERLAGEFRLDRDGTVVAIGGGCTTDTAGFAAATYMRGVRWAAAPTTLVGQVDAAIGGKTAVNLPGAKNLVGAFHWPERVVADPATLETLPARERREGMAEVVKTGLLAGEELWALPQDELVRRCAAFKTALCLRDPHEHGERAILNLGHTFAHALEAASGYGAVSHGHAVALGLRAALRLSGRDTDVVDELLSPMPARVDRDRAWEAMRRDKKSRDGKLRLVLLGQRGPEWDVQLPEDEVRRALDELIAG